MKKFLSIIFVISFMFSSISYTTFAQGECKSKKHKYEWVTTKKATYFKKGSKVYKCTVCGEKSKTEVIKKKKLKTPTVKITVAGDKVKLKCYKVKGATQFYVRFFSDGDKLLPFGAREYKYNDKEYRVININKGGRGYDRVFYPGTNYITVFAERIVNGKVAQSKESKKIKFVLEK